MGGLIGQWLALNAGDRVKKLIISNTSPKIGHAETWNDRIKLVNKQGLEPVAAATPEKWFTDDFIKNEEEQVQQIMEKFKNNPPKGYAANCAMVRDEDFREELKNINIPVLIISGNQDPVTTVEDGNKMQKQIAGSEHVILNAKHLSAFEKPTEFNDAIIQFLNQ